MTRSKSGALVTRLAAVMDANIRSLKAANGDRDIVEAYEAVVRFVRAEGNTVVHSQRVSDKVVVPQPSSEEISRLSIDQVAELLEQEKLPRERLELLAIHRFGVPKGSMRKWGRKEDLREKVLMMLRNERVHRTIGEVARAKPGSGQQ